MSAETNPGSGMFLISVTLTWSGEAGHRFYGILGKNTGTVWSTIWWKPTDWKTGCLWTFWKPCRKLRRGQPRKELMTYGGKPWISLQAAIWKGSLRKQ
ncbi:MAG TPA: hypothetical protein DCP64_03535 [Sarcina sp.]|nr:hypothetical protein [Sarcina sp.]